MLNIPDFRVEPADYKTDFDALRFVREAVFVLEQDIPESIEFDSADPDCYHVIARDNQHNAIGTARLSPDRKIGRMAVLKHWRHQGVGKALLTALLDKARRWGFAEVMLNAQTSALTFYQRFGFIEEDDVFVEANIPHQRMRLPLAPAPKSVRPAPKLRDAPVDTAETLAFEDLLLASLTLTKRARKQICIFTPDLELPLYGDREMKDALKQFAITSRGGNIMIIVQDTAPVRIQPHPLIELAQRLPSVFLFRTPVENEDLQYPSAYFVNDNEGYLFRKQSHKPIGVWSPTLPARNRQLSEEFDRVWQRSRPCTEFRALSL